MIGHWLTWRIWNYNSTLIGQDPWVGCLGSCSLTLELKETLWRHNTFTIGDYGEIGELSNGRQCCVSVEFLILDSPLKEEWSNYLASLHMVGIVLSLEAYNLV